MATPAIYRRIAPKLHEKKATLWRLFGYGAGLCLLAVLYAQFPINAIKLEPYARLSLIVTAAAFGALLGMVSFGLLCVRYWFGQAEPEDDAVKRRSIWPRVGETFGFSEWYACVALFSMLMFCVGLSIGMMKFGVLPLISMTL